MPVSTNTGALLSLPSSSGTGNIIRGGINNPIALPAVQAIGTSTGAGSMGSLLGAVGLGVGALGAGLGLYNSIRNKPKNINQDFSFDLQQSQYNPNQALTNNMNSMSGLGQEISQNYRNFLNPNSTYNNRQFDMLRRNVGDMQNQTMNNMNAAMAARGITGMSGVYDNITNRQAGDQFAQGQLGIMNQGAQLGQAFGGMALNAYGQAGQLAGQMDARMLQNTQFNTTNQNDYSQYLRTSAYNQQVQNQNARASHSNNLTNNLFNLAGAGLGMGRPK